MVSVGALLCVALLAGCGGGGDDEASVSKAEFIKKANALCAASQKKMEARIASSLKQLFSGKKKKKEAGSSTEEAIVEGFKAQVEGVEDLGSPKGYEVEAQEVLAALKEVVDKLENEPDEFRRSAGVLYAKSRKTAAKYDLDACGSPAGA